jgi:hypothetical protein
MCRPTNCVFHIDSMIHLYLSVYYKEDVSMLKPLQFLFFLMFLMNFLEVSFACRFVQDIDELIGKLLIIRISHEK